MTNVRIALLVLMSVVAGPALAKFAMPQEAPVERLLKNVAAYVKEHPKDPQGYYTLGRVNYLALSLKSTTVRAFERGAGPDQLPDVPKKFQEPGKEKPTEAELKAHLAAAADNFVKAIELDEKNGLYHLGLASLMEAGVNSGLDLGPLPGSKAGDRARGGKEAWSDVAIAEYLKAHELTIDADSKIEHRPIHGIDSLVSYEAGKRYVALVTARGPKGDEAARVASVERAIKDLDAKPRGAITPIVFSFAGAARLGDLLQNDLTTHFDLDGAARGQTWPWVKRDTSILVWDPRGTGQINSGRQLFGSVTWWIFWRDGYAALDALDDDRDGWLTGPELKSLAVWHDANANGISDPGEVTPVESTAVDAISVDAIGKDGAAPANAVGLKLKDGRVVGTWDWVVRPAAQRAE
jgi:hypothetical protein